MIKESTIPTGIHIDGQHYTFIDIHKKFAATSYGETLRANIRYGPYKPESMTNVDWERTLGSDVNNLEHLSLSYQLTRSFLKHCENPSPLWAKDIPQEADFSEREKEHILFTASVHDWAESIVGDIPYHNKTDSDEERELVILRGMIPEVLADGENSPDSEELADVVSGVLSDKTTKLDKAFNTVERGGYARTGLRAWSEAQRINGDIGQQLKHLAHEVVPFHTPILVERAEIYPAIQLFLYHHSDTISEIMNESMKLGKMHHDGRGLDEANRQWFDVFLPSVGRGE